MERTSQDHAGGVNLAGIIEIQEVGAGRANLLLSKGFELLAIGVKGWEAQRRTPPTTATGAVTYIRNDLRYVIGRREGQPAFPAWSERAWEQEPRNNARPAQAEA